MKLKRIILTVLCAAALLSCQKVDPFQPAALSGTWVFSAGHNGSEWKDLNIDRVYEFNGSGGYTVKDLKSGIAKVSFYNGSVYAKEDSFVQTDTKVYSVKSSGQVYRFESLGGDFSISGSGADEMVFDYSGSLEYKRYKLSRVKIFRDSEDPEPTPTPTPTPSGPSINGTELKSGNDLVGLVSDSATGKGIPDVVVSDGYDCVATDANGVYQFKSNRLSRLVFISVPSEYKIPVASSPSVPQIYKHVTPDGTVLRNDFKLIPLDGGKENSWTFIGIGDPQCATASNANRYTSETIPDIKAAVKNRSSVYAMTLGDIVFDSTNMWPTMKASMASVYNGSWFIPFFQTIGNHDHDSLKPDTSDDVMDDYNATATFVENYGPTDYSFNRGDVHIISMDDIPVTSLASSSKSNGKTWNYGKGISNTQLAWLKKDLELVPDKQNKMVFICCHIPFRNVADSKFTNCQAVVKLLAEFNEAHFMIGHTHYTQNYVYSGVKAKGGLPLYEHIHGSACGAWWTATSSSTTTGEPSGYTIYEIEGAHIKDWTFKGTNRDITDQLRVFDGNEVYYSSKSYPLNWYTTSQKAGSSSIAVKGNTSLKGCFVATVFNDDDTYWKVEMYSKSTGAKIGNFIRLANGASNNVAMCAFYFNVKNKNSTSYTSTAASHYWYFKPASANPAAESDWEVVATHTLPGGDITHKYSCSKLTTESDFAKAFYF